jgi:hypothetical protein
LEITIWTAFRSCNILTAREKKIEHQLDFSKSIISLLPNSPQNTCEQRRVIFRQLLHDLKNNGLSVVIVIESIPNNLKKSAICHTFSQSISSSSILHKAQTFEHILISILHKSTPLPFNRHGSRNTFFTNTLNQIFNFWWSFNIPHQFQLPLTHKWEVSKFASSYACHLKYTSY